MVGDTAALLTGTLPIGSSAHAKQTCGGSVTRLVTVLVLLVMSEMVAGGGGGLWQTRQWKGRVGQGWGGRVVIGGGGTDWVVWGKEVELP